VLNSAGEATIYGTGAYRFLVQDQFGNTISDAVTDTGSAAISAAMAPIVDATTVEDAVVLLGLGLGQIVPCTATMTSNSITLTRIANTNPQTETLGTFFVFEAPASSTGSFTVGEVTDFLSALPLYDAGGINQITSLTSNQLCVIGYVPTTNVWALLNQASSGTSSVRWKYFSSSSTFVVPNGVTTLYATGCGPGGGGGGYSNSGTTVNAGGGGGGGGAAVIKDALTVSSATTLAINIGAPGAGGTAASGSNGSTTSIVTSGFTTLLSLPGGLGGAPGGSGGSAAGGAAGGTGGLAGEAGHTIGGVSGVGGAGGGCLLGAGAPPAVGQVTPLTPGQFGGGGAGSATYGTPGATGAPSNLLLEW
jgi:hypothetical protein